MFDDKVPGVRELVLVVDDEPMVLDIVCHILMSEGFDVLRANSPEEALRIGSRHPEPIRMLLCDVVLPRQSGPRVADQFALLHPETVCLFMAGYPESAEIFEHVLSRGRAFLAKPFSPKTLVGKVKEVLESASGHAMVAQA